MAIYVVELTIDNFYPDNIILPGHNKESDFP